MRALPFLLLLALLSACASGGRAPAAPDPRTVATPNALLNGRTIFRTGRDVDGLRITASHPPLKMSCAACHRVNGAGGVHVGGVVSADLRYKALVGDQKPPYTLVLLERSIAKGLDNQGKPLSRIMPRWKMSLRDLHDVAAYLLTLR